MSVIETETASVDLSDAVIVAAAESGIYEDTIVPSSSSKLPFNKMAFPFPVASMESKSICTSFTGEVVPSAF